MSDRPVRSRRVLMLAAVGSVVVLGVGALAAGALRDDGSEPARPPASTAASTAPVSYRVPATIPRDVALVPAAWTARAADPGYRLQERRRAAAPELEACGRTVRPVRSTEAVTARLTGPGDARVRHLLLQPTHAAATRYVKRVGRLYLGCPEQPSSPGHRTYHELRDLGVRQQSLSIAAIEATELSSPAPGLEHTAVVRVGRSVVVDVRSLEATYDEWNLQRLMKAQRRALSDTLEAMCLFDEDRCAAPTG